MKVLAVLLALLASPTLADAALDDYKVIKLEQDVRRLEGQVRELARQIAELRRDPGTPPDQIQIPSNGTTPPASASSPRWMQAKRWQAVKVGMTEEQVIEALGPPTSTRPGSDTDTRILFYSLELEANSFLSGSIEMRDKRVVEIKTPELR